MIQSYQLNGGFGLSQLKLISVPRREPGPFEVLLEMRAWSLNYRDLMIVKGTYNPRLQLPMVPLSDGVGRVLAVGPGVTRVKKGDRVAGIFMPKWLQGPARQVRDHGALGGGSVPGVAAEEVVLHEDSVVQVPSHLSDEEAATLPCAAVTAWNAVMEQGQLQAGDTVLVEGGGGVSLFALQLARLAGIRVLATTSSEAKAKRLTALGAEAVVNYRSEAQWGSKIRDLTDRGGVDLVVEVGGAGNMEQAVKAVRPGGQIALIGVLAGGGEFNPTAMMMKQVRLTGLVVGSRAMFEAMNRSISQHNLRPVIDRVFSFGDLSAALSYLESGTHSGKIVLCR